MATPFREVVYDAAKCRRELKQFAGLLRSSSLSERDDIVPFFKARAQLSAFLGTYAPDIGPAPEIAFEFSFMGDHSADLVVGHRKNREYLAIEFEDGNSNSIFKKVRSKSTTEWSQRFEHGFSQLIDWFQTLDDYKKTDKFKREFGDGHITFSGLLIVGRNAGVGAADRVRLDWRRDKVRVDSWNIDCVTFDDLYESLANRLALYPIASRLEKRK